MFAEETIFCIWLFCAYKQSHVQFKKKKKASSPHSRFSPLLQVVLKRMLPHRSGSRQGKGMGRMSSSARKVLACYCPCSKYDCFVQTSLLSQGYLSQKQIDYISTQLNHLLIFWNHSVCSRPCKMYWCQTHWVLYRDEQLGLFIKRNSLQIPKHHFNDGL